MNGILQLLDAIDMADHMPDDLRPMLSALFEYRNKMFHLGLEWPLEERQRFDKRLSKWPREWFSKGHIRRNTVGVSTCLRRSSCTVSIEPKT